jgi:hypothetical protein
MFRKRYENLTPDVRPAVLAGRVPAISRDRLSLRMAGHSGQDSGTRCRWHFHLIVVLARGLWDCAYRRSPPFGDARHLRNGEGKQAVRMMFPAVETAAKVLHPGALARLMPNEVDKYLLPRLEAKYAGNQPAMDAGRALLKAFKEWIIAAQPYRHGQEVTEPAEPPQDFVVAHMSSGAAFLRWMIDLSE